MKALAGSQVLQQKIHQFCQLQVRCAVQNVRMSFSMFTVQRAQSISIRHSMYCCTRFRMCTVQHVHCTAVQGSECARYTACLCNLNIVHHAHCTLCTVYNLYTVQHAHCTMYSIYIDRHAHFTAGTSILHRMHIVHCTSYEYTVKHVICTAGTWYII